MLSLSQKIELGRQVQIDYPDIVNDYRDIKNGIDDIVLNIMNKYNLHSEDIAKGVLQMALHGYNEGGSSVKIPASYNSLSSFNFSIYSFITKCKFCIMKSFIFPILFENI